jgi:putative transposase
MKVQRLCRISGMSRQNYYKGRHVRRRRQIDETVVLSLVRRERGLQPKLGTRKLHHMLRDELTDSGVSLGRDSLFGVLRRNKMLIPRRRRYCRTTDSRHDFKTYSNLLKNAILSGPGAAMVSDITYIRTDEGFLYLSLVMDAYSRAVVGWDCGDTLEAVGCIRALKMAMRSGYGRGAIHHSDRGVQYCCGDYISCLRRRGVRVSMTEVNHCYENAAAERLNGILKQEYGLGDCFASKAQAQRAVAEAVEMYNWLRPHTTLGFKVPMAVHGGQTKSAA